jgi:hypothetical protein
MVESFIGAGVVPVLSRDVFQVQSPDASLEFEPTAAFWRFSIDPIVLSNQIPATRD